MSYVNFTSVAGKARSVNRDVANASRSLAGVCLNGPLGMKRGRGMHQEYSTTGARMQEAQCFRGLITCRFVGEWDYSLDSPPGGAEVVARILRAFEEIRGGLDTTPLKILYSRTRLR